MNTGDSEAMPDRSAAAPAPSDRIIVEPQLTADDLLEFWAWRTFHEPAARAERRRGRWRALKRAIVGLLVIAATVWYWTEGPHLGWRFLGWAGASRSATRNILVGIGLTSLAASALGAWWLLLAALRFTAPGERSFARRQRATAEASLPRTPVSGTLTLSAEGVRFDVGTESRLDPWSSCVCIHETATQLIVQNAEGDEDFLPLRFLGEGRERSARVRQIMEWAHAGGGGQKATLVPFLASHDVPCVECGYNLRGIKSTVCPECGVSINHAAARRPPELQSNAEATSAPQRGAVQ